MLKLKLQYFGHVMWRADSLKKTLMQKDWEKEVDDRGWNGGWHHWLHGHEFEQTPGDGKGQGSLACYGPWVTKRQDWATEQMLSFVPYFWYNIIKTTEYCLVTTRIIYSIPPSGIRSTHVEWRLYSEVKSLNRVRLFVTLWTVAYQAPPSMGFSSQEYWSGLPFPFSGDLPNPGIEPRSPSL